MSVDLAKHSADLASYAQIRHFASMKNDMLEIEGLGKYQEPV